DRRASASPRAGAAAVATGATLPGPPATRVRMRDVLVAESYELGAVQVGVELPMLEELLHRLGERLATDGRARRLHALDLGPAQIELEVKRASLVGANRGMIEVPGHGPRHVEHQLPHDLIVDRRFRGCDRGGDPLVQLWRRETLALDRREVDVTSHGGHRSEADARARQLDQEVALAAPTLLVLVLQLAPGVWRHVLKAPGVPSVGGD